MLRVANVGPPLDYSLCNQTVTIYHQLGAGEKFACTRTVFRGAFLDQKKVRTVDKTGSKEGYSFLAVSPSGRGRPEWVAPAAYAELPEQKRDGTFTLSPGDKLLPGAGPEIADRKAWSSFVPATTPGLVVVSDVDVKLWEGSVCHVEAGG